MKLLAFLWGISSAWHIGVCSEDGPFYDETGYRCRNSCKFDWIGRNDKIHYREFGRNENGFLAQLSARKWGINYLGKEDPYIGMLRFDRTYCKRPILKGKKKELFIHFDRNICSNRSWKNQY